MALAAARKIASEDERLKGFSFDSAGTDAPEGFPASKGALIAMREAGTDLGAHRSKRFTERLARWADVIFAMEQRHIAAMAAIAPDGRSKMRLLCEYSHTGGGIPDPFGADIETYRAVRDAISAAVEKALKKLAAQNNL
jgi:protein-tyrosine-phosphatase